MLKINSEKELLSFLKILTEESVKKSKRILKEEEDPFNSYYKNKRKSEESLFEQEDDAPESTPPATQPPEDGSLDAPEAPEEEAPQSEESNNEESFVGSKDRLVDFVNDIRSAPSIKDSAVSSQIDAYYDRLSQEEKDVLVFFLRELSRVMTGKASGEEARDPSDPPLNIDFVPKNNEVETKETEKQEPEVDQEIEQTTSEKPSQQSDEEDTSPPEQVPIKVNESQDHQVLRRKIKKLLG